MTGEEMVQVLVQVAAGGLLVELARALIHRKGMNANTAKTITDAAITLVEPLQERVTELEGKLRVAETRAVHLEQSLRAAEERALTLGRDLESAHAELAAFRGDIGPPAV